jgi:hypothetical protein
MVTFSTDRQPDSHPNFTLSQAEAGICLRNTLTTLALRFQKGPDERRMF